jgi:hypothetical protein
LLDSPASVKQDSRPFADHGEVGDFEPAADLVEESELRPGRMLDVVPDELDEIRPDQPVDVVHNPEGGPGVVEVGLGQVQVPGDHDNDRVIHGVHGRLSS